MTFLEEIISLGLENPTRVFLTVIIIGPTTYCIALAIYRLYFHPLAHIPGPKLAALTSWYEFYYDVVRPGRYVFKIRELHKQYGKCISIVGSEVFPFSFCLSSTKNRRHQCKAFLTKHLHSPQ